MAYQGERLPSATTAEMACDRVVVANVGAVAEALVDAVVWEVVWEVDACLQAREERGRWCERQQERGGGVLVMASDQA